MPDVRLTFHDLQVIGVESVRGGMQVVSLRQLGSIEFRSFGDQFEGWELVREMFR